MRSETLVFEHTCSYGAGYFGASVINGKDVSKNICSQNVLIIKGVLHSVILYHRVQNGILLFREKAFQTIFRCGTAATFRNQTRDQSGRGHIKGRIGGFATVRCNLHF